MAKSDLQKRIEALIKEHGGVRAAAAACRVDPSYLCRMRDGVQVGPTDRTLERLGLKRVEQFKPL